MFTGEKRNCYCAERDGLQTGPPSPGKATNNPGQLETSSGSSEEVAGLLPAGAKGELEVTPEEKGIRGRGGRGAG